MPERPPPGECANCGASLPRHARACPACGADERTGWRETTATLYDGLDLPDSAYADDTDSSASPHPAPRRDLAWQWYLVAAIVLLLLILSALGLR